MADQLDSDQKLKENAFLLQLFVFCIVIFLLAFYGGALNDAFSYDRASINSGEYWRILTGNFMHLSVTHALMNLSVLCLVMVLFQGLFSRLEWLALFILNFLAVGIGLHFFDPKVANYVGLSGGIYGLIAACLLVGSKRDMLVYSIIYCVLLYKVVTQQFDSFDPQYMQSFIGGSVIASSHLFGFAMGNFFAIYTLIGRWRKRGEERDDVSGDAE